MALPNAGQPRQGNRGGDGGGTGLPFLKADMLSEVPTEARILMVSNQPKHRFGPSVIVKIELGDKNVLWTLHIHNNPNFAILRRKLGGDEAKWIDAKILLSLVQDELTEQFNIRASFPSKK